MAPEYGATLGIFPPDQETLDYMKRTGRSDEQVDLVKKYLEAQDLLYSANKPEPVFSSNLELDMGTVKPCLAGPRRPQDQLFLNEVSENFCETMRQTFIRKKEGGGTDLARDPAYLRWIGGEGGAPVEETEAQVARETEKVGPVEKDFRVTHGSVVIASITSCTNTSNLQSL